MTSREASHAHCATPLPLSYREYTGVTTGDNVVVAGHGYGMKALSAVIGERHEYMLPATLAAF